MNPSPNISPDFNSRESEILHQMDDALFELNTQGEFLYANAKAGQLLQRPVKDLLGKNIWIDFKDSFDVIFYTIVEKSLKDKIKATEQILLAGINSLVSVRVSPSFQGIIVQLTETKKEKSEPHLRENKVFIESIVSTTPDLITIQDANTNQILYKNRDDFWSHFNFDIYKLPEEGRAYKMIAPEDIDKTIRFLEERKWLADDEMKEVELKLISDGWIHIRSKVFKRDEDGKASQIISFTSDISRAKKNEKEIKEQSHFIHSITDMIPAIITITKHPSGEVVFNNRNVMEQLGFDADEIIEMAHEGRIRFLHPNDLPHLKNYYSRFDTITSGEENNVEYRIKNKKGEWIWLDVRGKIFKRDSDGRVTHTLHIGHDITARRKAEEEILHLKDEIAQKVKDKYLTIFNSIDQGFSIYELVRNEQGIGIDYRALELNPAFEKQTGIRLETLLGRTILEIFPTLDKWWIKTYAAVVDNEHPAIVESYFEDIQRWYEIEAYPMKNDQFAVFYKDITDRKRREEQ